MYVYKDRTGSYINDTQKEMKLHLIQRNKLERIKYVIEKFLEIRKYSKIHLAVTLQLSLQYKSLISRYV